MTKQQKRKTWYVIFKVLSVIVSCAFPIWAIFVKFPVWRETHGDGRSFGVGAILMLFVVLVIFRKTVLKYFADKFNLQHAPPITVWVALLIVSYILIYIANFLRDFTLVLWMGTLGCGLGMVLTFFAENVFNKDDDDETKEIDDGQ